MKKSKHTRGHLVLSHPVPYPPFSLRVILFLHTHLTAFSNGLRPGRLHVIAAARAPFLQQPARAASSA